ncbi:MAG TPA: GFA family protein, partial [Candidatus Sulfotelmatobacter sp.]|nr:GFA family protein [Candidatus Sulfotelmatobacter sp.]
TRRAQCSCGQLSATCSGEPVRLSVCHCMACKQRTGSAFSFNAWFTQQDVRIEGRATEFVRVGDEGGHITFRFCPNCGATVYWNIDRIPGTIAIAAGSFADMSFPAPAVSVYKSRRYPWVEIRTDQLEKNVRG